ncbi:uncharacterized protein EKO05_0008410 [Ascochyta rabiei]|uniref:Uncharacterized protein n=1 Tax=Didymella rabiei TaxID=5454 RepID=A0A163DAB5_DIDRA|nr:uncharacterized protein EKO05_0008410 [Ascochyta rabiei]KZM23026.1 hypothetical protein ST47_g5647 [Ascochyta rabiei]UPX18094.1 hypothetical protein EKO05_0008410 [Ascochyta rabiei]
MTMNRATKHRTHFSGPRQDIRPIFTSLNGDNSWLLSFPRPVAERKSTGKAYFHVVLEPWLNGPQVEYASWLAHLSLSSQPAVSDGAGVENLVQEVEQAAADAGIVSPRAVTPEANSPIDAVFMNFHYGDHLHVPTLLTFNPTITVFATVEAAAIIKKLNHFDNTVTYKDLDSKTFNGDWTNLHPGRLLPSYLTLFRIRGHHELNFLSALIWSPSPNNHEAVLYSPHGLHTSTPALQTLLHHSAPEFKTLALLHGLKESWTFNWQTTFGVATGLELQRETNAEYWINTHNDRLGYWGLVWFFANDIFKTIEWGLGQEKKGENGEVRKEVKVIDVENGGCLVLE